MPKQYTDVGKVAPRGVTVVAQKRMLENGTPAMQKVRKKMPQWPDEGWEGASSTVGQNSAMLRQFCVLSMQKAAATTEESKMVPQVQQQHCLSETNL
ncbi:hypothetical protein A0H81_12187 [Grifola frondosa]|uniref:Uncharacterized protein n=1 Tax=Grifola frondosa TaxID=5627 RepID=A0A1C7LUB1_GRIFR|nr:hypothetical protein A0H81_12187 [Grifola frondosa]